MSTSEQARNDAMADAETLRLMCQQYYPHSIYDPVSAARRAGAATALWMRDGLEIEARSEAILAASHAFFAVPGLRGE